MNLYRQFIQHIYQFTRTDQSDGQFDVVIIEQPSEKSVDIADQCIDQHVEAKNFSPKQICQKTAQKSDKHT